MANKWLRAVPAIREATPPGSNSPGVAPVLNNFAPVVAVPGCPEDI
jgi:hypothetical protein